VKLSAEQRFTILNDWTSARTAGERMGFAPAKVDEQLLMVLEAKGTPLTRATLYNWRSRYLHAGFKGLIDRRSLRGTIDRSNDPFFREAARLRSAQGMPLSMKECHRLACVAAVAKGWKTHSFWAVKRYFQACGMGGRKANRWASKRVQRPFEGR